jgi:hypothetical protein
MTRKRYTAAMQRLYEREVMTFLDNLPNIMVEHHTQLIQSDDNPEQVRQIWKRRVDYVWLKFLLNEQELQQTEEQ